ncbi:tyrosine-type recombinase/integrase [Pontibacter sp. HSC-14F20]|uniref:tyrosine-type recombinase/integrase n=1 Tax=Pontibacter sp. HSC-14F20 TaxID=2864136 RepID=UPI00351D1073
MKLRITYLRQRKYYNAVYNNVNCTLTESEFEKTQGSKPREVYKKLQIAFQAIEQKALNIIKEMPVFSFDEFEKRYYNIASKNDIFTALDRHSEKLIASGRVGTAKSYENAGTSLLSFIHKEPLTKNKGITIKKALERREQLLAKRKPLPYSSITSDFLSDYEKWMLHNGNSITTIGIYLRAVRAMYNSAIADGEVSPDLYPFGKRKYQIPAGRNIKKALTIADIEKIFSYEPKTDSEAKARDLWVFSYLASGINIKDIARLKYRNIDGNRVTFIRAKTERTNRQNIKSIVAMIPTEAQKIIDRWGTKPTHPDNYVFPILQEGITPTKELALIKQATKTLNHYMKRIAASVGIEKEVTSYTARHSFATVLKRAGAPIEFISESLGHGNLRTTASYLDSFEDNVKQQYTAQLTAFSKENE